MFCFLFSTLLRSYLKWYCIKNPSCLLFNFCLPGNVVEYSRLCYSPSHMFCCLSPTPFSFQLSWYCIKYLSCLLFDLCFPGNVVKYPFPFNLFLLWCYVVSLPLPALLIPLTHSWSITASSLSLFSWYLITIFLPFLLSFLRLSSVERSLLPPFCFSSFHLSFQVPLFSINLSFSASSYTVFQPLFSLYWICATSSLPLLPKMLLLPSFASRFSTGSPLILSHSLLSLTFRGLTRLPPQLAFPVFSRIAILRHFTLIIRHVM